MGKKYLDTKKDSLEQSVLSVWKRGVEEGTARMDGRTTQYREHRKKLESARERRQNTKTEAYEIGTDEYRKYLEKLTPGETIEEDLDSLTDEELDELTDEEFDLFEFVHICTHPAGTTRMSASKEDGVVDKYLRSHFVDNLYICSSSTFPTISCEPATYTISALAIRLSEHLIAN